MKQVSMTLFCPPVGNNKEGVLHMRPACVLDRVCCLFTKTEIRIRRDPKNCHPEFLKECPMAVVDPQNLCVMTTAFFKHGEKAVLEVKGENEDLAAALVKTAFEHLDLEPKELLSHLVRASEIIDDPDRAEILAKAKRVLSPPAGGEPAMACLSVRLHNLTVAIFPELARHLDCSVMLSYQMPSGLIQHRHVTPDDPSTEYALLKDNLAIGTPITINAEGQRGDDAVEVFQSVIENLSEIEQWIKHRRMNVRDPALVREILAVAHAGVKKSTVAQNTITAQRFRIRTLLDGGSVLLSDVACSKDQAIQDLATMHALRTGLQKDMIAMSVWDREDSHSTLWPVGVAVPHAHLNGPKGVQLVMGIYKGGIGWMDGNWFRPTGDSTAYVILMFLAGSEAQDEYVNYLGRAARLFDKACGLVTQLRAAQSVSHVIDVVQNAESTLAQA